MKPDYVYKDGDFKIIREEGFHGKPVFIVTQLIKRLSTDKRRYQFHFMDDMQDSLENAIKFLTVLKEAE